MEGADNGTHSSPDGHVHLHGGQPVVHAEMDPARAEFMKKHRGHESLHAALVMGMFTFLLVAQLGLVLWKKRSPKTFNLVTLCGMLFLPPLYSLWHSYWRFIAIWVAFMAVSGYFLSMPFREKPMKMSTPRKLYWFFFLSNKVAFAVAVGGYALVLVDQVSGKVWGLGYVATLTLFYGLLYGVIARDLAALCADKMAKMLGYQTVDAMPDRLVGSRVCAICSDTLESATEEIVPLPDCGHEFHSFCIRGWRIVGKDECPRCKEKVELSHVFVQPWEKQSVVWSYVLDVTRYLIVWNPLIFGISAWAIRTIDH